MSLHAEDYYRAHYAAVRALLPPALTVYEGSADDTPSYPYLLLGGGLGQETGESLTGRPDTLELAPKVTYAAATLAQLLMLVSDVRPALINARPVVPGWVPSRLGHASVTDAHVDFNVIIPGAKSHPFFAVDEFPFTSQRA
jgi:hypothetical protein